jgi:hypothetical protein
MKQFKAPWSKTLMVISVLATLLCAGASYFVAFEARSGIASWPALLPLALVAGSALFTIRGYSVAPDAILVKRLLWTTRLKLEGLKSAQFDPEAMRRSIRLFGNGGIFSFTGLFRSKALGNYRAFATDQNRTVVLRYASRTVVVSPADTEEFVREVCKASGAVNLQTPP